ncbi:MAG TPA: Hsp20/alpha crystallin family protein [Candidatus Acidoferrales bacterium]|nr:Hsp20/alpha crystallin family protein [Candidatus Acidoferrales bacterium]
MREKDLALYDNFFEDLFDFRRDFDQIFNRMLTVKPWTKEEIRPWTMTSFRPAVESFVDKEAKRYFLRVVLPGVDPKDVQIHVQGNLLNIIGERKFARTVKEAELFEKEIAYGKFERTLTLPEGVNGEKLVAEYVNGVLELTAPVSAEALPKKIEIRTVPLAKQIAA